MSVAQVPLKIKRAEGKTEKETEVGAVTVSDISWAFAMTPALL